MILGTGSVRKFDDKTSKPCASNSASRSFLAATWRDGCGCGVIAADNLTNLFSATPKHPANAQAWASQKQRARCLQAPTLVLRSHGAGEAGVRCCQTPSPKQCSRSSVVEHSLGKGEVVGSIPTASSNKHHQARASGPVLCNGIFGKSQRQYPLKQFLVQAFIAIYF
jgi:hypothetical protein